MNCEIYNDSIQIIGSNDYISFEKYDIVNNISIIDNMYVKILSDGIYVINISIYLLEEGIINLFINDKLYNEHFSSYSEVSALFIHKMLILKANDMISIKNCSNKIIITKDSELCPNSKNFDMVIWKITSGKLDTISEN